MNSSSTYLCITFIRIKISQTIHIFLNLFLTPFYLNYDTSTFSNAVISCLSYIALQPISYVRLSQYSVCNGLSVYGYVSRVLAHHCITLL